MSNDSICFSAKEDTQTALALHVKAFMSYTHMPVIYAPRRKKVKEWGAVYYSAHGPMRRQSETKLSRTSIRLTAASASLSRGVLVASCLSLFQSRNAASWRSVTTSTPCVGSEEQQKRDRQEKHKNRKRKLNTVPIPCMTSAGMQHNLVLWIHKEAAYQEKPRHYQQRQQRQQPRAAAS